MTMIETATLIMMTPMTWAIPTRSPIDKAYALDDDEPDGISGKLAKVRLSFKLRMLDLSNSILQDLTFVVADCVKEMQEAFKEGLEEQCKLGAEYVSVMQC